MDQIPIFSGEKFNLISWLTCGQYLSLIEDHATKNNLIEAEIKELCLSRLSESALELFQKHQDSSWIELKNLMYEEFPVKLSIRDKVEVRKKLQQQDSESVDEFYQRCVQAQYLVSDDTKDAGFEREILLHFLIGLLPFIRDLVLATKCSSTIEYINEAKKYVQIIKEEPIEADVKIETELQEEDYDSKNPLEYINQYDEFGYDYELEDDIDEKEETIIKSNKLSKWICVECNDSFTTKQNMKTHCQSYHNKCAKCDKTFVDKDNHYKVWHSKVECKHCEFSCNNKNILKEHMKEKHKSAFSRQMRLGSTKCKICNEEFDSKELCLEHEEQVHGHLKQTCEMCNEVCLTIKVLALHIAKKHCPKNSDDKYVCLYCSASKKKESRALSYHILNTHFNQSVHKCSVCERGFDTKSDLEKHIKTAHVEERESFQCDKCPKSFKSLLGLNLHVKGIHIGQKEAECKMCDKTFRNERYLKNHQKLMHSGERTKWVCDDCGKSFLSKQLFKNHCLRVHLNDEEKAKHMHPCPDPQCDNTFLTKDNLNRHFKRVHLKEKNYQCSLCPKGFFTKRMFDEHTNGVHLNLKPLQCEMCEFATAYSATFREHQKVAHGSQRYYCPYCNHAARYKGNLDKHINNVHKNINSAMAEKTLL